MLLTHGLFYHLSGTLSVKDFEYNSWGYYAIRLQNCVGARITAEVWVINKLFKTTEVSKSGVT